MESLPLRVLLEITKYMEMVDYVHLKMTCRKLQKLNREPAVVLDLYKLRTQGPIQPRLYTRGLTPKEKGLALVLACQRGHLETVQELLQGALKVVDDPIRWAAAQGHLEITRLLLKDDRFNPAHHGNLALCLAVRHGHLPIVALLLKNAKVDPCDRNHESIRNACRYGHVDILVLLLLDGRAQPMRSHLEEAASNGHDEIVSMLLRDERVDARECNALLFACQNGHAQVVSILLKDPRMDPTALDYECLLVALDQGHQHVVQVLIKDPRLQSLDINGLHCRGR